MSVILNTASAMISVLTYEGKPGARMRTRELRRRISERGGDPRYLSQAAKLLRDHKYPVYGIKAGPRSGWVLVTDPKDVAVWNERMLAESYSQFMSFIRSIAYRPEFADARNHAIATVVSLGAALGVDATTVIRECEPEAAFKVAD